MAYSKTTWVDNTSPDINATNLNHLEDGVEAAAATADAAIPAPSSPGASSALLWTGSAWEDALVSNANVAADAAIAYSKLNLTGSILATDLASGAFPAEIPHGSVTMFAGAAAPTGWLLCDGTSYLRASYADLFAVISTTYGSADGTHFNVPDLRGRMVVGLGTHTDIDSLGENDGVTVASRRPKHNHSVSNTSGHGSDWLGGVWGAEVGGNSGTLSATGQGWQGTSIGPASAAPTDAPAYLVLNYIIKT